MRFNDVVKSKRLLKEGIKYGAKEEQEVLNNLDKFRIGIEIELQVPKKMYIDDILESGAFEVNNRITMDQAINDAGVDRETFYRELSENLVRSLEEEEPEVADKLNGNVDEFYIWALENIDVFKNYKKEDDPDKSYAILKSIIDAQYQLSGETFSDFSDTYLPELKIAMTSTDALATLFAQGFIDALKDFIEELQPYVDDESLRPLDDLDADDIEFLTDENELRSYASNIVEEIKIHNHGLYKISDEFEGTSFYKSNLEKFYRHKLEQLNNSINTVKNIGEYFLNPSFYDDVETYMIREIIPFEEDDIMHLIYVDSDNVFEDVDYFEDMVIDHISDEGYETEFKVEQEHDYQIEIITKGNIVGDDIETAWEDTWDLFDSLGNLGMTTQKVSGMHVSISMPESKGKEPNLMKFMVISNILNLIPTDASNVRTHVNDIRNNYYNSINLLIQRVWSSIDYTSNISQAYSNQLDLWLNQQTFNSGEKYQTVNFGKMDVENGRIEIRMFGGEGYEKKKNEIWKTIIRSMYALMVAYDDQFKRKEYLKSVNKIVQDVMNERTGYDFIEFILRLQKLKANSDPAAAKHIERIINSRRATDLDVSDEEIKNASMKKEETINESRIKLLKESGLRLKDMAKIKINMEDADFFIKRRGSLETVGSVSKDFDPYAIGVKVERTDVLNADFLYYWFMNLHSQGYWKNVAKGTTNLVNITMDDIRNIKFR